MRWQITTRIKRREIKTKNTNTVTEKENKWKERDRIEIYRSFCKVCVATSSNSIVTIGRQIWIY